MHQPEKHSARDNGISCAIVVIIIGVFIYSLLPAVHSVTPRRRMPCTNNLKVIVLALHNYHDVYGALPPAFTVDQNGRRFHSWRTLVLPYLEQCELYKQIRLDEPWNSTHNRRFADLNLSVYRCPKAKVGLSYLAVTTPGAIFDGPTPCSFLDITDGTSNTIAVIEVPPRASSWMEPVDFDQQQLDHVLANGLSETHPGGTQVSLMDGSVRWVQSTIPDQTFNALLTRNGGEELRDEEW